jgi:hypothetical protein
MKLFAAKHAFPFPYLYDESQAVARAYRAECTPDYFGLNAEGLVQYRGRLDEGRKDPPRPGVRRELLDAMRLVATPARSPADQIPVDRLLAEMEGRRLIALRYGRNGVAAKALHRHRSVPAGAILTARRVDELVAEPRVSRGVKIDFTQAMTWLTRLVCASNASR